MVEERKRDGGEEGRERRKEGNNNYFTCNSSAGLHPVQQQPSPE